MKNRREKDELIVQQGQTKTETTPGEIEMVKDWSYSKVKPRLEQFVGSRQKFICSRDKLTIPKTDYQNLKDQIVKRQ